MISIRLSSCLDSGSLGAHLSTSASQGKHKEHHTNRKKTLRTGLVVLVKWGNCRVCCEWNFPISNLAFASSNLLEMMVSFQTISHYPITYSVISVCRHWLAFGKGQPRVTFASTFSIMIVFNVGIQFVHLYEAGRRGCISFDYFC